MKFLQHIDLVKNELRNALLHLVAGDPASPTTGQVWFDTVDDRPNIQTAGGTERLAFISDGGGGGLADGDYGDVTVSGSGAVLVVDTVGGADAEDVATAALLAHPQNTDVGTTATSFEINTGGDPVKLKTNGEELHIRNGSDDADVDLFAKDLSLSGSLTVDGDLTVSGTNTILNTTTMQTGDNEIVLNSEITTAAGNTNGGVAIKRLQADNATRSDAKVRFNETSDRWEADFGPSTAAAITRDIALRYAADIGNNASTQITVTHNLNTEDVTVALRLAGGTKEAIIADWRVIDANSIRVDFTVAPTSNEIRVVVVG